MDKRMFLITVGARIRNERVRQKKSQEAVTGVISKDRSYLSRVENGIWDARIGDLFDIAETLNIPVRYLIPRT